MDEKEKNLHSPVWIKEEDVLDFLSVNNHKFLFREYLGKSQEYDSLRVLVEDIMKV